MSTAGRSARAEYTKRRQRDLVQVRDRLHITIPIVVLTLFVVYVLVRLGINLVNGFAHKGFVVHSSPPSKVAGPTESIPATLANEIAVFVAVAAALGMARELWGRRPTTEAWRIGAEGEEALGRRLAELEPDGYRVLHDLSIPGSRANIDHLVIGPTGVFAIDAKNYTGRLAWSKGTLWHGRYPLTKKIATTRWEAEQMAEFLSEPGAEWTNILPLMCVLGADLPRPVIDLDGVHVVSGGRRLLKEIRSGTRWLSEEQIDGFAKRAAGQDRNRRVRRFTEHSRSVVPSDLANSRSACQHGAIQAVAEASHRQARHKQARHN